MKAPIPIHDTPYHYNFWYGKRHEYHKCTLICRFKNNPYPVSCWPNAGKFIEHASGKIHHESNLVRWMAVDMFEDEPEINA